MTTINETLAETLHNLEAVKEDPVAGPKLPAQTVQEVVTDKGYHSASVVTKLVEATVRTYIPEPDRGGRRWKGKRKEQAAVYGNPRRVHGSRSNRIMRRRRERVERSFEHVYDRLTP